MLYMAWRHGGEDPYRLYNGLDEDYRPFEGGSPRPPTRPWRVKCFLYACAAEAQKQLVDEVQVMSGGSVTRRFAG